MDYVSCDDCNEMKSHTLCLEKEFSAPEYGSCPHCSKLLVWGDLIQASKLRDKFVQDGISYSSIDEEDMVNNEEDIMDEEDIVDVMDEDSDSSVINLT